MTTPAPRYLQVAVIVGAAASAAAPMDMACTAATTKDTSATSDEEHCVVHVLGRAENGRYLTDEPTCYPTLAEALADAGGDVPALRGADDLTAAQADEIVQAASITLGTHYDGANRTGSSITVSGAACDGGYVNLSSTWINRISSTTNSCATVNFWDGFDKSGSYESTNSGNHNLGSHDNAANSVGYTT